MVKYRIIHNYERTGELKKNGTASILIRAYLNGRNKYFNTGIYLQPTQWDTKTSRVINHPKKNSLNQLIQEKLQKMEAYEIEVTTREGGITLERLADFEKETINLTFTNFFKEQLEKSKLTTASYTDQRQTFYKLREYRTTICFSELSYKLIHGFDGYLSKQLNLHPNTVAKHHKNLKKYIHLAISFDYLDINRNPYKKFKVEREPTERLFLTENELRLFEQVEIPARKSHLNIIKDFFLFCCYTGLRYSDVARITKDWVSIVPDGLELYLKSQKTHKPYQINLRKLFPIEGKTMSRPEAILKKYLDFHQEFFRGHPAHDHEPLFQKLTNQYINRELKVLAEMLPIRAALKERLSIHAGRHTFGTVMAGKVPIPVLQELMQHSKIKETMIYVHMNKKMINRALDDVDW